MNKPKIIGIMIFSLFFVFALLTTAKCAEAATITAASCNQSAVQTALNSASNGDTITVPLGSCTWSGTLTISKGITLQGAGKTSTKISGGSITISLAKARVTGFGFTGTTILVNNSTGWRIDNNSMTYSSWTGAVLATNIDCSSSIHSHGVFDNNTVFMGTVRAFGNQCMVEDDTLVAQNRLKAQPIDWITWSTSGFLTVEDNFFNGTTGGSYINFVDGNYSSRILVRHNTIQNTGVEWHGMQGQNRAPHWGIWHDNTFSTTGSFWMPFYIRGGTGLVYNNTVNNTYGSYNIAIDNQRSCRDIYSSIWCNGNSLWDQNSLNKHGYACRDQIGRGSDLVQWVYPSGKYTQQYSPLYGWNNKRGNGVEMPITLTWDTDCSRNSEHLVANRDYYSGASAVQISKTYPFDGTVGVGYGTLANRPDFCATNLNEPGGGVAYWAMDTNTLYRCSATNTWTVQYKPYTYPHPLRSDGPVDTTPPAPPKNIKVL